MLVGFQGRNCRAKALFVAPHQDDAVFGCGGLICQKAASGTSQVRILYVTDGSEGHQPSSASMRKAEAVRALGMLGVPKEEITFWDMPDGRLMDLWRGIPADCGSIRIKSRLIDSIRLLLAEEQPDELYLPHPLDSHSDHLATFLFFNYVVSLNHLKGNNGNIAVFCYSVYGVHEMIEPDIRVPIQDVLSRKQSAMTAFTSQLSSVRIRAVADRLPKHHEDFWRPVDTGLEFLGRVAADCERAGRAIREIGYQVNLGVVLDVSREESAERNPLVKKKRIFSSTPEYVSLLGAASAGGYLRSGVIPCLKHFPGLGGGTEDSHLRLPRIDRTSAEVFSTDLVPFKDVSAHHPVWIMTSHAVYPDLDEMPASLSTVIISGILRSELGFEGVILSDELMVMQALDEFLSGYEKSVHGLAVTEACARYGNDALKGILAIEAGTDLVMYFTSLGNRESRDEILSIRDSICRAVRDGWIPENRINESLNRLLNQKASLFGPDFLEGLAVPDYLTALPLERKIEQMMVVDTTTETRFFETFSCGGVFVRNPAAILAIMADSSGIPPFIIGQIEGGPMTTVPPGVPAVESHGYLGTRYTALMRYGPDFIYGPLSTQTTPASQPEDHNSCDTELSRAAKRKVIEQLIKSLRQTKDRFRLLEKTRDISPPLGRRTALVFDFETRRIQIQLLQNIPYEWAKLFSTPEKLGYGYGMLREAVSVLNNEGSTSTKGNRAGFFPSFYRQLDLMITYLENCGHE